MLYKRTTLEMMNKAEKAN